jgi:hypothetical protein
MKPFVWLIPSIIAASVSISVGGAPYSVERMVAEVCAELDHIAEAVESVTDEGTAEIAVTQLNAIGHNLKEIAKRAEGLPKPNKERGELLTAKFEAKLMEVQTRFGKVRLQLFAAGPKAGEILGKGMADFRDAMQGVGIKLQNSEAARPG